MYIAQPQQEPLPYGRWAEALSERFVEACRGIDSEGEDIGDPGEVTWFPDRTLGGRTYIPASSISSTGFELFGFVSFTREHQGAEASGFESWADFTDETAEANPDWTLDLRDHQIGAWRGVEGRTGELTLVWGDSLVRGGAVATTELGPTTTDQCILVDDRFTLVSLDAYTGDYLEVRLYGERGVELAVESLYEDDEDAPAE
jgi:hypothetical protein